MQFPGNINISVRDMLVSATAEEGLGPSRTRSWLEMKSENGYKESVPVKMGHTIYPIDNILTPFQAPNNLEAVVHYSSVHFL